MTLTHLANLMQNWGYTINRSNFDNFTHYLRKMLERDRVLIIYHNDLIACVAIYFLTDNVDRTYRKKTWEIPDDNPQGHQIYIEKMVCYHWSAGIRRALQEAIEAKFPQVTEGYYHRAPRDRCVKIYRRRTHELHSQVR